MFWANNIRSRTNNININNGLPFSDAQTSKPTHTRTVFEELFSNLSFGFLFFCNSQRREEHLKRHQGLKLKPKLIYIIYESLAASANYVIIRSSAKVQACSDKFSHLHRTHSGVWSSVLNIRRFIFWITVRIKNGFRS